MRHPPRASRAPGLILVGCLAIASLRPVAALALERQTTLSIWADHIRSSEEALASRGILKAQTRLSEGEFAFNAEGFGQFEAEDQPARLRRSDDLAALQELYVEYRMGPIFIRAGRQPVRWSQSWTLPSLDVFTARRWERLFFDPVPEQLRHPDGVLATFAGQNVTLDGFLALRPARSSFPPPFAEGGERPDDRPEGGARLQLKLGSIDTSFVYKGSEDRQIFGAAANVAFDWCVLKFEAGGDQDENAFFIGGLDVFVDRWTFLPQVTQFRDALTTFGEWHTLAYAPLRWQGERWSFETQAYYDFRSEDLFASAQVSRDLTDTVRLTAFAQTYQGREFGLFGAFERLTAGGVGGLRLEFNQAL